MWSDIDVQYSLLFTQCNIVSNYDIIDIDKLKRCSGKFLKFYYTIKVLLHRILVNIVPCRLLIAHAYLYNTKFLYNSYRITCNVYRFRAF